MVAHSTKTNALELHCNSTLCTRTIADTTWTNESFDPSIPIT